MVDHSTFAAAIQARKTANSSLQSPVLPLPDLTARSPATTDLAAQIIVAGRKRRGELAVALPPKGSLAAQIVEAGAKRRGEI
jgi:hypothetical protein